MPPVIKVENLSKMYRLGEVGTGTVRDDLARAWAKLRGKEDPFQKVGQVNRRDEAADGDHEYVWALQDINFEVEQGEILGIIGRNGAGKSTLLKLLSRITSPTTGRIRARGRIASLLEVGTGFHPELTGRENIYLNGALLGMTRREVTNRLEEIVEFSGCAKYIDTPVKRYSSGMTVRLGFSVAAHLECEILIVDEVLAVGDAEFQKRCLGKMSDVARDGRTILFVSHNLGSVERLCKRCLWLANGNLRMDSWDMPTVIGSYLAQRTTLEEDRAHHEEGKREVLFSNSLLRLKEFYVGSTHAQSSPAIFRKSDAIQVNVRVETLTEDPSLVFGFALYSKLAEAPLFWSFNVDAEEIGLLAGEQILSAMIPPALLNDGDYTVEFLAALHNREWLIEPHSRHVTVPFRVTGGALGSAMLSGTKRPTLLTPIIPWNISRPIAEECHQ